MSDLPLYLEIGPLKEGYYTGISQVTAAIADCMLGDAGRDNRFFYGRMKVARGVVEDLVRRRDGNLLEWYLQRCPPVATPEGPEPSVALFPNRKTCRRGFAFECQIIHDLSTLLTPQFHTRETIAYHAGSFLDDLASNDLTFCVSDATRADVLRYLGPLDPARVIAVPLAASVSAEMPAEFAGRSAEPYVVVLGTIEPRKNIAVVLEYLARNPAMLGHTRFVFLGRQGWGESFEELLGAHGLAGALAKGRILAPGYVSEQTKNLLLQHAALLIYPSLFEGFGLPVLEGLALGVPAVTTRSSSLPEVGGACCFYFDPFTPGSFDIALSRAELARRLEGASLAQACIDHAAAYSWAASYARLRGAIDAACAAGVG